ncbi:MAG TPA: hypothetical protein VGH80_14075 [Xanthomonadaceae bacterium]|jgi:hypothetical protein
MPRWVWILLAVVVLGWLVSPSTHSVRVRDPGVLAASEPEQHNLDHAAPFQDGKFSITPLADFSVTARVLSRADYRWDRSSALSPTDLALGWGRMSDSAVLARLDISQSGRWYYYHWSTNPPPIPQDEIIRSSANMHMIPANDTVRYQLDRVHPGDVVHLEGQLIEARGGDGSVWRSSMTRTDTGDGACEVVFVRSLVVMM